MSLINKMLQDLDARGTPAVDAFPSNVRPVAQERRTPSPRLVGMGAALVGVAGVAVAWYGWHHFHAVQPAVPVTALVAAKPVVIKPVQGLQGTITPAPAASKAPPPQIAPAGAVEPQMAAPAIAADTPRAPAPAAEPKPARSHHEDDDAGSGMHASAQRVHAQAPESKSVLPMEPDSAGAREARHAAAIELATREARLARLAKLTGGQPHGAAVKDKPKAGSKGRTEAEGRQELPAQQAENEYRRALASLQDGRMAEAVASLQLALRIDPGHDAARQTLVGLLVEGGRTDDAIRELQLGLARDARQPALAMLLARLQIERGGSGIETLQRTLPYAGNDPEYHAFLAGALARQQRHRDAVDQYQQALRAAPGNGVWWMGLGISLQADKRNAEALEAFERARASGSLNADLQNFVERRIQQLGR